MPVYRVVIGHKVGPAKRQRAIELRRDMTPAERVLWKSLRGNQLLGMHFRRQQVIEGFIVDFYCHAALLVVEVDGSIHETQRDYDASRDQILMDRGLKVIRFTNEEVMHDLPGVMSRISAAKEKS